MIVESKIDELLASVDRDFRAALEDAADYASRQPGAPSDLRAEHLGRLRGRIGSSKPYAKAQERGAFITPRKGRRGRNGRPPALRSESGRFYKWIRIRPQRYLAKTGKQWGRLIGSRLRSG